MEEREQSRAAAPSRGRRHGPHLACLALVGAVSAQPGCAPLTFSNEAAIDFARYPRVRVEMSGPDGARREAEYLRDSLADRSGFSRVTLDPEQEVDAVLDVRLAIALDFGFGSQPDTYDADALFFLIDGEGFEVDRGSSRAEDELDYFAAGSSALDGIVQHYLPDYRL